MISDKYPLVSVGIPVYNRPQGLKRTLEQITTQTYSNLDIIVSDNASPTSEIEDITRQFMERDQRIKFYRQKKNKGTKYNFWFVFSKALGEYFMWAADDDEWEPTFIETCINHIGNAGSIFTGCKVLYRKSNRLSYNSIMDIDPSYGVYKNIDTFLKTLQSSIIYGLHRRDTIMYLTEDDVQDFWEYIFAIRQIHDYGFKIHPEYLYTAGIDDEDYIKKPLSTKKSILFTYRPLFFLTARMLIKSRKLKLDEKLSLLYQLTNSVLYLFIQFEKDYQPLKVKLAIYLKNTIRFLRTTIKRIIEKLRLIFNINAEPS